MLELLGKLERWIRALAVAGARDASEADDYEQEAAIVLIGVAKRYQDRTGEELLLIAKRSIRNRFCDMARRRSVYDRYSGAWEPTVPHEVPAGTTDAVRFLIEHLPPEWREYAEDAATGFTVDELKALHGADHKEFLQECRFLSWRIGGAD